MDAAAHREANLALMTADNGYDVIIVSCNNAKQAEYVHPETHSTYPPTPSPRSPHPSHSYWTNRLRSGAGQVAPAAAHVFAVHEDWEGGAGNALGTLYAYQKACAIAPEGFDMTAKLSAGEISVAM